MTRRAPGRRDPLARLLEGALALLLFLAPLPFGAVTARPRMWLEVGALLLVVVWAVRATRFPAHLPPRVACVGLVGLLALATLQALPVGARASGLVSPRSALAYESSRTPRAALAAERDLLGVDPARLDRPAALSVDPEATASALRTGAALVALLLVATTVAATRGVRLLALALLLSAAFQGLYGVLVLASGHDMIWHVPKRHYLDSATGTFVNRNHYAGFLAAALCCGLALVLHRVRRRRTGRGRRLVELLGAEGSQTLLLGLLLLLGLSALLLSFSRAGIAIGLATLALTALAAGRLSLRARVALIVALVAGGAVPLSQLGSGRLAERYAQSVTDFATPGGRATVWRDTVEMATAFPVTGSGFGTFASAYPLFRSPEVRLFFRHAHNEALQFVAEGGVAGALLLALVLAAVLARVPRLLRGRAGALGAGVAAGLLALLLHCLVDFPLRIPAVAATASILSGAALGLPWKVEAPGSS